MKTQTFTPQPQNNRFSEHTTFNQHCIDALVAISLLFALIAVAFLVGNVINSLAGLVRV